MKTYPLNGRQGYQNDSGKGFGWANLTLAYSPFATRELAYSDHLEASLATSIWVLGKQAEVYSDWGRENQVSQRSYATWGIGVQTRAKFHISPEIADLAAIQGPTSRYNQCKPHPQVPLRRRAPEWA